MELDILQIVLSHDLEVSTEREVDWHTELVVEWKTEEGWVLNGEFREAEGLLVVDWESVHEIGKSFGHEFYNRLKELLVNCK